MNVTPDAMLFGKIPFYNFTHYNTDDVVRVLEAPYISRKSLNIVQGHGPTNLNSMQLSYGDYAGQGARRVWFSGRSWNTNGILIVRPHHLYDNPVEGLAMSTEGPRVPINVVEQLLDTARKLMGGDLMWVHRQRDVSSETLSTILPIRIDRQRLKPRPKRFMLPHYAKNMLTRKQSKVQRSLMYAGFRLIAAENALSTSSRFVEGLTGEARSPQDIIARLKAVRTELYDLRTHINENFYPSEVAE